MDDLESLRAKVRRLEREITDLRRKNADLASRNGGGGDVSDLPVSINEFEETLRRLVQRTAMIVQAEKCIIMVRDRETGDLFARSPAFGMSEEEVREFRVSAEGGISGSVFRGGEPAIFHDAKKDPRAASEDLARYRIHNGVTVPLIVEKRDEQNRLTDRLAIGVLHCFNKRYGGEFIEEDVRLLERLSRNAAAVIANAQMFQEIIEEKQKLVHTLESLTAGLVLINQHGRIGQMNAQARAMFAVAAGTDPVGKEVTDIIRHEQCLEIINRKIAEAAQPNPEGDENDEEEDTGPKPPDEITVTDQDGEEYIYQVHAAGVHDDNNQPIGTVVIFNDITDIRNVERMKTEFVSIVSHELRTPLTPMKGFVRTLLDDPDEELFTRDDRLEFYGIIDSNVDRLSRLINDLLNVSRIEKKGVEGIEMTWEDVDLHAAAEEVVTTQKGMTDTGKHTLVVDFDPEHITAETDPDKIQNILQNLVSNAIKYSPDGGEVRIIGRLEPQMQTVLIGVKDQGMGIPEAYIKKLFGKFVRVPHKSGGKISGTGIGLYLVRNLVEAHWTGKVHINSNAVAPSGKGHIWAESELGKGTTFWFRIPLQQPEQEPEAGANAA
jgi:two-component system phosphate regulon sensor histidine kinase PhoR